MDTSPEKTENISRPVAEPSDEDTEYGLGSLHSEKRIYTPDPNEKYEPVPSLTPEQQAFLRQKASKMAKEVEERIREKQSRAKTEIENEKVAAEMRGLEKAVAAIDALELGLDTEEHAEYVRARQTLEIKIDELDKIQEEIQNLQGTGIKKLWHFFAKSQELKTAESTQTRLNAEIEGLSAIVIDFEEKFAKAKEAKEKIA